MRFYRLRGRTEAEQAADVGLGAKPICRENLTGRSVPRQVYQLRSIYRLAAERGDWSALTDFRSGRVAEPSVLDRHDDFPDRP